MLALPPAGVLADSMLEYVVQRCPCKVHVELCMGTCLVNYSSIQANKQLYQLI